MKGLKAILGIALSVSGLGTAVALGTVSVAATNEVAEVEAAVITAPATLDYKKVFCTDNNNWGTMYCHYWGGSSNSSWPGLKMTVFGTNEYSQKIFGVDVPSGTTGLIFHNNSGMQTNDLTASATDNSYWLDGKNLGGTYSTSTKVVYCFDKVDSLLTSKHQAYTWKDANNNSWPGEEMHKLANTNSIYYLEVFGSFTSLIFNNKTGDTGGQTADLTVENNKTWVLESDWSGSWISLEAATYIDTYLHFKDVAISNTSATGACLGNNGYYKLAKSAYGSLSSSAVKSEVGGIPDVEDRLNAWASANHESFSVSSGFNSNAMIFHNNGDNKIFIGITFALISILGGTGLFFFIRKRRYNQ